MQKQYTNSCATLPQSPYSARNPVPMRVQPSAGLDASEGPSQSVHRVGHGKAVPRVTGVRARGSLTKGKPIGGAASLVTPSLAHLSSCVYPGWSNKRRAGKGKSQRRHATRSTTRTYAGTAQDLVRSTVLCLERKLLRFCIVSIDIGKICT